jgi:hypothetical protein
MLSNLNDEWINIFEKNDSLYQDFYKDNLYYANIHFIYINKNNEIETISNGNCLMSKPNYITIEEFIKILKTNIFKNNIKYSLMSVLKYNVTLDVEEINHFLNSDNNDMNYYNKKFLSSIKNIDNICFDKTINMFQDLNSLFILFYEKSSSTINNITKKIYLNKIKHKRTQKHIKN